MNYQNLASIFLARLARSCTKSCKSCTKQEAFLARYEKSCKNLARKICKIIFLQDFDQILQENYLTIFSYKILARFFVSCKKSFIFSARLARYVQDLVQDLASLARKLLARFACFLQDRFYWVVSLLKCDPLPQLENVEITGTHILCSACRIQGGAGPDGCDSCHWCDVLLRYGAHSARLRDAVAALSHRLEIQSFHGMTYVPLYLII